MKTKLFLLPISCFLMVACGEGKKKSGTDTVVHEHVHDTVIVKTDTAAIKPGQEVYFINLKDGATVKSPVKIEMGVKGMTVEPAGALNPDKGHHHLIINGSFTPVGITVPADSTHIHFGKGQTDTLLNLPAGKHTLTLQFADGMHSSYGAQMSKTITIEVKK